MSATAVEELLAEGVLQAHPTFFEVTTAVAFELFRRAASTSPCSRSALAAAWMRPT